MAPIHHHFELCGWSETRVVAVFSIITAILCLISTAGIIRKEKEKWTEQSLKGKRVLVFGSGISGIGAVRLLEAVQADVILYDGNEKLDKEEIKKRLPEHSLCDIVLGDMPQDLPSTLDLAVMSPGVPLDIPPVEALKRAGIPVWGEVELAYRMGAGTVLAITGTNGKTTTTFLIRSVLEQVTGKKVGLMGTNVNIVGDREFPPSGPRRNLTRCSSCWPKCGRPAVPTQ